MQITTRNVLKAGVPPVHLVVFLSILVGLIVIVASGMKMVAERDQALVSSRLAIDSILEKNGQAILQQLEHADLALREIDAEIKIRRDLEGEKLPSIIRSTISIINTVPRARNLYYVDKTNRVMSTSSPLNTFSREGQKCSSNLYQSLANRSGALVDVSSVLDRKCSTIDGMLYFRPVKDRLGQKNSILAIELSLDHHIQSITDELRLIARDNFVRLVDNNGSILQGSKGAQKISNDDWKALETAASETSSGLNLESFVGMSDIPYFFAEKLIPGFSLSLQTAYPKRTNIVETWEVQATRQAMIISGFLVVWAFGSWAMVRMIRLHESVVRANEKRINQSLDFADVGVWESDFETGNIYWSSKIWKLFGYSEKEIASQDLFISGVHPDDRILVKKAIQESVDTGEKYQVDHRVVRPDGTVRWVSERGDVIRDAANKPITMVGVVADITERKLSEETLRTAFDNVTVGNIQIDGDGMIRSINPTALHIFGYSSAEVIGQNIKMLMPESYKNNHDQYLQNYLETGVKKIIGIGREVAGLRKNGETFPMLLGIGEMYVEGKMSFVGSITDVTHFKELEDQLRQSQKMEAVGQLTGGVAHDFNNLLAVVIGNAELLEGKLGDNLPAKKNVNAIIEAVKRGASLTSRLLAFSRSQPLVSTTVALNGLLLGMDELLRRMLSESIAVKFDLVSGNCSANIDAHQFEAAILNLAINASHAMPDGGNLTICTARVSLDKAASIHHQGLISGEYIKITVLDTGGGISSDVLDKVFDPFFTTKNVGEGSGLGLSMVYGFTKQSGGQIEIESDVGKGTAVHLYFPRAAEAVGAAVTSVRGKTEGGSESILVVEDDPDLLSIVSELLQAEGYILTEVKNGQEAVEQLKSDQEFDILFTDVVLPGTMNGVEIADEARRLRPGIKVLFTSGYAQNSVSLKEQLDVGMELISKPYKRAILLKKMREILDASDA